MRGGATSPNGSGRRPLTASTGTGVGTGCSTLRGRLTIAGSRVASSTRAITPSIGTWRPAAATSRLSSTTAPSLKRSPASRIAPCWTRSPASRACSRGRASAGTTGMPKGVVRDNGGHLVALTWSMKYIYGVEPGEVYWAASDLGWVVGHSYILYGPLFNGNTTILYEGKPVGTPDPGAFWRVISQHGVRVQFTAPTAIRAIKRDDPGGEHVRRYDLSGFRTLFLAGERCDSDTLGWAEQRLGVPVIDHWWQTETGWPIAANCLGLGTLPVKPGSCARAVPGYDVRVLGADGSEVPAGQTGR